MQQLSPVQEMREPIIFDNNPPSYIVYTQNITSADEPKPHVLQTFSPITELEPYQGSTETYQSWSDESDQRLSFRNIEAFAADPNSEAGRSPDAPQNYSGVSRFEYALSGEENMPAQEFDQVFDTVLGNELIIENPDFEVGEEIYWHVRAVDHAGNFGDINTFGPMSLQDYTLPVAGELRAIPEPNGMKLFVIEPPFDPESDLLGIQYALSMRNDLNGIIRPFPNGDQVDLGWDLDRSMYLHSTSFLNYNRYIEIPEDEMRASDGDPFYILYRSVNTEGMTSDVYATGPLVLDGSPPLSANIDVRFNYAFQQGAQVTRYRITVGNLRDFESGIKKVEYWIERRSNPTGSWGDISNLVGFEHFVLAEYDQPRMNAFMLNPVYSPSLNFNYPNTEYRVKVRITNGSGLTRVQTAYPN